MKSKFLLFFAIVAVMFMVSCHMTSKDEIMKKAAQTITEDFVTGNIDGFIASLDTSVQSLYPANEVLAAYQAISMIMGAPSKDSRDVSMHTSGKNPVVTVVVPYEGGKIAYQTGFDTQGKIVAFAPVPLDGEVVYSEEEIMVVPDSVATAPASMAK